MTTGNGESAILETLDKMMEGNGDLPQTVTNRLLLSAIVGMRKETRAEFADLRTAMEAQANERRKQIADLCGRVESLEDGGLIFAQQGKNNITWSYLRDKFFVPALLYVLTFIIAFVLMRATGFLP